MFFFENFNGGSISAIYNKTTSLKNYVTILRFFNSTYLSEKDLYNFEFVSTITIQNDKESWILIGWKTNKRWTKVLSRIIVFFFVCASKKSGEKFRFGEVFLITPFYQHNYKIRPVIFKRKHENKIVVTTNHHIIDLFKKTFKVFPTALGLVARF